MRLLSAAAEQTIVSGLPVPTTSFPHPLSLLTRVPFEESKSSTVKLGMVRGPHLPLSERSLGRTSLSLLAERSDPEPVPSSLSSRSCFSASIALMASFALAAEFMCAGPASLLPTTTKQVAP